MITPYGNVIAEIRYESDSKLNQMFFDDKNELDSFIRECYDKKIDFQIIWMKEKK